MKFGPPGVFEESSIGKGREGEFLLRVSPDCAQTGISVAGKASMICLSASHSCHKSENFIRK